MIAQLFKLQSKVFFKFSQANAAKIAQIKKNIFQYNQILQQQNLHSTKLNEVRSQILQQYQELKQITPLSIQEAKFFIETVISTVESQQQQLQQQETKKQDYLDLLQQSEQIIENYSSIYDDKEELSYLKGVIFMNLSNQYNLEQFTQEQYQYGKKSIEIFEKLIEQSQMLKIYLSFEKNQSFLEDYQIDIDKEFSIIFRLEDMITSLVLTCDFSQIEENFDQELSKLYQKNYMLSQISLVTIEYLKKQQIENKQIITQQKLQQLEQQILKTKAEKLLYQARYFISKKQTEENYKSLFEANDTCEQLLKLGYIQNHEFLYLQIQLEFAENLYHSNHFARSLKIAQNLIQTFQNYNEIKDVNTKDIFHNNRLIFYLIYDAYCLIVSNLQKINKYQHAQSYFEKLTLYYNDINDENQQILDPLRKFVYMNLDKNFIFQNQQYDKAEQVLLDLEQYQQKHNILSLKIIIQNYQQLRQIASIQNNIGKFELYINKFSDYIKKVNYTKDFYVQMDIIGSQARLFEMKKDYAAAIKLMQQMEGEYKKLNQPIRIGLIQVNEYLSQLYLKLGQKQESIKYLNENINIIEKDFQKPEFAQQKESMINDIKSRMK